VIMCDEKGHECNQCFVQVSQYIIHILVVSKVGMSTMNIEDFYSWAKHEMIYHIELTNFYSIYSVNIVYFFLLKICSSDLISEKWITSLYNPEVKKMTPLDFRLTATSVFRSIASQCRLFKESIDIVRGILSSERLVSSQALSEAAFDVQVRALREKFIAHLLAESVSSYFGKMAMIAVRIAGYPSVIGTNSFLMSLPGSNKYEFLNNIYPIHDNVTSINVSYF
jgi:hypothetical protein